MGFQSYVMYLWISLSFRPIEKYRERVESILESFGDKTDSFRYLTYPMKSSSSITPAQWWKNKASASPIKYFMVWICSLSPSSERCLDKVFDKIKQMNTDL